MTRVRATFADLPVLMHVGMALLVSGGATDVVYHVALHRLGGGTAALAGLGHLVTLTGMVVTLIGLAAFARNRSASINTDKEGVIR